MPLILLLAIGAFAAIALSGGSDKKPSGAGGSGGSGSKPPAYPKLPASASKAATLAPQVADDIFQRGARYDREMLAAFQSAAGITNDGLYGGGSAGALAYWLGVAGSPLVIPPDPLFKPYALQPYTPPAGA